MQTRQLGEKDLIGTFLEFFHYFLLEFHLFVSTTEG